MFVQQNKPARKGIRKVTNQKEKCKELSKENCGKGKRRDRVGSLSNLERTRRSYKGMTEKEPEKARIRKVLGNSRKKTSLAEKKFQENGKEKETNSKSEKD